MSFSSQPRALQGFLCGLLAVLLALGVRTTALATSLRYDLAISIGINWEICGQAAVTWTAPVDISEVVFRLYPAAQGSQLLTVVGAWVDGESVPWEASDPTTLIVPLVALAGQTYTLTLSFAGMAPAFAQTPGYGVYARSPQAVVLTQAYPILAPWDGQWVVHPVLSWGDPLVAEVADYALDLTVPEGWVVVAGGTETEVSPGRYRIEGENLRELAFVLLHGYEVCSAAVDGVVVRSFFRPEHRAAGVAALSVTVEAIEVFAEHLGPHPFADLDVIAVPLREVAGIEYPGLILAGEAYYESYPSHPLFFPMIFAHEVAHQWWYAEVGNDQVAEPWVDEALATYTSGLYFQAQGRFREILSYWEQSYRLGAARNPRATVSSPLTDFPGGEGYGGIVYSGGALFLHAVRERMGDDAFFGALRRYRDEFRWRLATGADLLRMLTEESPQPVDDLLKAWLGP